MLEVEITEIGTEGEKRQADCSGKGNFEKRSEVFKENQNDVLLFCFYKDLHLYHCPWGFKEIVISLKSSRITRFIDWKFQLKSLGFKGLDRGVKMPNSGQVTYFSEPQLHHL